MRTYGYGPSGSLLSSSQNKAISCFLVFVGHVDDATQRRHSEHNNLKDDGEAPAGPTDGLIQRPLLIQEARNIEHL